MAVFQVNGTDGGFANMRHNVVALYRVGAQHLGNRRGRRALFVHEVTHPLARLVRCGIFTFEEGNAPTIRVVVCAAAALRESGEAQRQASGQTAVHSK